jgi:hypothetical protein
MSSEDQANILLLSSPMSASGYERTFGLAKTMSAVPAIADLLALTSACDPKKTWISPYCLAGITNLQQISVEA